MPGWYSPLQASAKAGPVEVNPKRSQHPPGLSGDPCPPVDQGPEYVEEHRPNGGHRTPRGPVFRLQEAPE